MEYNEGEREASKVVPTWIPKNFFLFILSYKEQNKKI